MAVKFDESFARLLEIASERGMELDKTTVIVRDGSGRLTYAQEQVPDANSFSSALREGLGAYAAPVPVVSGPIVNRLLADPRIRRTSYYYQGVRREVLYADRRIVGSDWMLSPRRTASGPKRLVFSSLKGGVGRSTALTVLSADLARSGKRVLAIDLDVEAPGIGFLMLPGNENDVANDRRPLYGVIDYLVENGLGGIEDHELDSFVGVSPFSEGFIDVIPAVGRVTDAQPSSMIAKLSRALVEDVTPQGNKGLAQQVREMVDRFATFKEYDVILIDARAGIAEISAAALLGLGAELMLFGIDQPQTFRGYRYILSHLIDVAGVPNSDADEDWREKINFVQARAPSSPTARQLFRERLHGLCSELIYEAETLDEQGRVQLGAFNPALDDFGPGVPHDATHIENHVGYEAFDPLSDDTRLDTAAYQGPFGPFLTRCRQLLLTDHEHD